VVVDEERSASAERAWRNVLAWCHEHAPVTAAALHGPVEEGSLAAAQEEMGFVWPRQLVSWLRVGDGADRSWDAPLLPPTFIPLGVELIMNVWRMMARITDDTRDVDEIRQLLGEPAGSRSWGFLRTWIPIADDTCGNFLFVDVRAGPRSGCVCEWEDGGYLREPLWDDLAAMLPGVDDGLRTGRLITASEGQNDKEPLVEAGRLSWADSSGDETIAATGGKPAPDPQELRDGFLLYSSAGWPDGQIAVQLGVPRSAIADLRRRLEDEGNATQQRVHGRPLPP
jgi:cell wall assembly regulator SMI1